jgi:cell division protein FtsI (penicillin-binding protein 3)
MSPFDTRRGLLLAGLLAGWALLLVARLAQVQILRGPAYRRRARQQQERTIAVEPRRGAILDREGRELAVSVEASSVFAVPEKVADAAGEARVLSRLLRLPQREIASRLDSEHSFAWIARKVDDGTAEAVRQAGLPGVSLLPEPRRFYPNESLASNTLGYVGLDGTGLAGLEYQYDRLIQGTPGEMRVARDARQGFYALATIPGRESHPGASIRVTLDRDLQFIAERELARGIAETGARDGSAVLFDPESGDVLALASVPTFDPNRYAAFPPEAWRNRAIADSFEPGSVFKVITGAAAIESGVATPTDPIDCGQGVIQVGNFLIHDAEHERFGVIPLSEVIARSSNVGIIRVGLRLGPERLFAGARSFGIGQPTGVDLPGENPGILREVPRWSALSNAAISMGQEVAVTPIQLAQALASIANGGFRVAPRILLSSVDAAGNESPRSAPPRQRVVSGETASAMNEILKRVVSEGTGKKAGIPGFVVAGKTGTAQKAIGHGYAKDKYVATFAGYAPADRPRLVAVVTIDEPQGKYFASEVAAPVFQRIVSRALTMLNIPPDGATLPAPPPPATAIARAGRPAAPLPPGLVAAALHRGREQRPEPGMPDLSGLSARRAVAELSQLGLAPRLTGTGFVIGQDPPAGAVVSPGEICRLRLSESPSP